MLGEQARRVHLRRHVRQLEADPLEVADRPAELAALLGVGQRRVEGAPARSRRASAAIEMRPPSSTVHRLDEAVAFLPSSASASEAALLEDQRRRVRHPHPDLVLVLADDDPGGVERHHERRDAAVIGAGRGARHHHRDAADGRVGDEVLAPVSTPAVAVAARDACGSRRHRSRPRARSGPTRRGSRPLASWAASGASARRCRRGTGGWCTASCARRPRAPTPPSTADQLLEHRDVVAVGESRAAVLLGHQNAEQPELAERAEHLAREVRARVPVAGVRRQLAAGKVAHHRADIGRSSRVTTLRHGCPPGPGQLTTSMPV